MKDLLLNEENDIDVNALGDFAIGESDVQHQKSLLETSKGDWKEFPSAGVGLIDFVDDEETAGLLIEIKKQFQDDGMILNHLGITEDGKIQTDASYK